MNSRVYLCGIASALAGVAMLALSACGGRQELSQKLQGTWASNPEMLSNTGATQATLIRGMEFSKGDVGTEVDGNITLTAMITVENTMPFDDALLTPLTISATGTATITGAYVVKDDDEVNVVLDATSLTIDIDPKAVQLDYDVANTGTVAVVENLKANALRLARQQISRAAHDVFYNLREIDDIHIQGDILTCEMSRRDLTFRRQPQ